MLGRYELVTELARIGLGFVEYLIQLSGERRLSVRLLGVSSHLAPDRFSQLGHTDAEFLQDWNDDALILGEHGEEQVQVVDERIPGPPSEVHCLAECFGGFYSEPVRIDHAFVV